jgi:very-short-patch-repair endonuclease
MQKQIHNLRSLKGQRKLLRNHATSAEAVFWEYLKNKQLLGKKFRRQHSIGQYIVDFYCPEEQLIIELDGQPLFSPDGDLHDQEPDEKLRGLGFTVMRFENSAILENIATALEEIVEHFGKSR